MAVAKTDLDDIVMSVAVDMATEANLNGYHGQMEFLKLTLGLTDQEIEQKRKGK